MESLNPSNECNGLLVEAVTTAEHYKTMFEAQLKLQERLGRIPHPYATLSERTKDIIYWGHCVSDEFVELVEWLPASNQEALKEARMEYIDMVHFGFNLAIALSVSPEALQRGLELGSWSQQNVNFGVDIFDLVKIELNMRKKFADLMELLPWKTWKVYAATPPMDLYKPKLEGKLFAYLRVLMSLAGALGMDLQMVTDMYFAKNKENHRRQDNGY